MMMNRIIHGDCLEVLPKLPRAKMVFADPPDNLGMKYNGFEDRWPSDASYIKWLADVTDAACKRSCVFWLSYYWKWDFALKGRLYAENVDHWRDIKPYVWWFTFGQHRETDNGSCFRPLLRFSVPSTKWHTDAIREPSARQREYDDSRADPRGRVPGDVWDGVWKESRVCGTFKEKRKWHLNQHPEALLERIVKFSAKPGDLVIDLFGGTFTTARVCQRLGIDCISIEISESYCRKGAEELGVEVEVL